MPNQKPTFSAHLYSDHHVEMSLRVLFDHVPHIVRLPRLLKLSSGDKVFDLANGANRVLVSLREATNDKTKIGEYYIMHKVIAKEDAIRKWPIVLTLYDNKLRLHWHNDTMTKPKWSVPIT